MSRLRRLLLAMTVLPAAPAAAQTLVASPAPDRVAVTVYRDPGRGADQRLNLSWLNGFALISETRQVTIPAGESEIRFEGVAGGIVPQSAIVTGLPDTVERNRDAYLLSPGTLLDRSLGRRVHLRRTSLATGEVREQEAVIRSGADGAVVLQTAEGFEALRCTGLAETLVYDEVPPGLSARPTLSVRARSPEPVTATVTLSYLATGFDWQANYVATLSADESRLDLFAWLTLANGDETGFVNADTQAVAGRVNYEDEEAPPSESRPLTLHCWPQATTSDIPLEEFRRLPMGRGLPMDEGGETLYVTGSRIPQANLTSNMPITVMSAEQEELGDLKLYRIPEPVTVAAHSQKQVALLNRPRVQADIVYRQASPWLTTNEDGDPLAVPATLFLVARNREAEGLGLPLPAGSVTLFARHAGRPILIAEGAVRDTAVGEDVEIELGGATGVRTLLELVRETPRWDEYRLTVTNDHRRPVRFEARFPWAGGDFRSSRRLGSRRGRPVWEVTVPANGSATLRYRLRNDDDGN